MTISPELIIAAAALLIIVAAVLVTGWRRARRRTGDPRTEVTSRSSPTGRLPALLAGIWESFREPRVKKLLAAAAYVCAVLAGVHTIREPPSSLQGVLGLALTTAWGLFYLAGGVLGLGTVAQGWWWLERIGIYTIIVGAGLYLLVILYLHYSSESGNRLPQYWAIAISVPLVLYRGQDIRKLRYEPRR